MGKLMMRDNVFMTNAILIPSTTAGIGENSAIMRKLMTRDMEWAGLVIDEEKNKATVQVGSRFCLGVLPSRVGRLLSGSRLGASCCAVLGA